MRTDDNVSRDSFRHSEQWETDALSGEKKPKIDRRLNENQVVDGELKVHSLSGHERNHLFLNRQGKEFSDISVVSGLDTLADSRTFVIFDYDRDGWSDIAMVNANAPLLNLYRNNIALRNSTSDSSGLMIALRFVGANHDKTKSSGEACRDGYGAIVTVEAGELSLKREHYCGGGFGAQNSATMAIGIGTEKSASRVTVRWPSGKSATINDVPAGTLLKVYENAKDSPEGKSFSSELYLKNLGIAKKTGTAPLPHGKPLRFELPTGATVLQGDAGRAKLRLYTSMATWCDSCKRHLPEIANLKSRCGLADVAIIGIPIDSEDNREKLAAYDKKYQPAYGLHFEITETQRQQFTKMLTETAETDFLPSTIITDREGNVLLGTSRLPTLSEIRKLLSQSTSPSDD